MSKISCIIVDYYKAEKILKNIQGILLQKGNFELEIIVLDNSISTKNANILRSAQRYNNNFKLIIASENMGYSRGNNAAVAESTGDFILIINPDIEWDTPETLSKMIGYLQKNPDIGIIGPRQEERSGGPALSVRAFPKWYLQIARRTFLRHIPPFRALVEHDEMLHMDRNKTQEVDWLQSSCFLLSRDLWNTLGGFNEDYFLFLSDTELCKKCWEIGKKVVYFAESTIYSDGIRCSNGGVFNLFTSKTLRTHVVDSWRYFQNTLHKK